MPREMKDSEIDWIGVIPKTWDINKIKYVTSKVSKGISPKYTEDEKTMIVNQATFSKAFFDIDNIRYSNDPFTFSEAKIKDNDILIATTGGGVLGKTFFFKEAGEFLASTDVAFLRAKDCVLWSKFLFYCLTINFDMFNAIMANGSTNQTHLDMFELNNMSVPFPPLLIQGKIIAFLDIKCSEIDALSSDIQSEIDTLEEYKKSVITEAVTKGLDPDAKMKDSGIEWIGKVPENWKIKKIKYCMLRDEPRNPGNKEVLSVYREYGVILKNSRDDNHNVTSQDVSKYKYVQPGNLVINKMKAWQGSMGVSRYEGIVSPAYFIYKFKDSSLVPMYLHYLLRTIYKDEFMRISGGIREGQWDLPADGFENTLVPIPSIKEQNQIVQYVDNKCTEIDAAIEAKKQQLETLDEYKKSLIYEYVTGKKEVV